VAAYAPFDYTTPTNDQSLSRMRLYTLDVYTGANTAIGGYGQGPIPYSTRYMVSGSNKFIYVQCDRKLVVSGSMTTTTNYVINGVSAPTVTAVVFTTNKSFIKLALSGTIPIGPYTLSVKTNTFGDGTAFNIVGAVPIFIDYSTLGSGTSQVIDVGTPVMS